MRLFLSSYGLGNAPDELSALVGDNKRTAIIMNSQDAKTPESRTERLQREIDSLAALGLQPEELDLRKYFGKSNELRDFVKNFGLVWVRGGNVFVLRKAFKQSGFDEIITDLLKNDQIAYGGYSAGVCVLAPSLHGIELVDPKDETAEGYDTEIVWDGLGVLGYAVAPHYKSDHPESDDINKCVEYFADNHILFKTLRDGEIIVVNGDNEKIIS